MCLYCPIIWLEYYYLARKKNPLARKKNSPYLPCTRQQGQPDSHTLQDEKSPECAMASALCDKMKFFSG